MSKSKGLFWNTVLLGASGAVAKAATFLLMPFYTAALSPADFGVSDLVASSAVLLLPFVTLNAGAALFRFFAGADEAQRRRVLSCAVVLLAVGSLGFLLLLPLLRFWPALYTYRVYLLLYVLSAALHGVLAHMLRATGAYHIYAILQPFTALVSLLLQILLIVGVGLGAKGYLLGIIFADMLSSTFLLLYLKPWRLLSLRAVSIEQLRAMLRYGLPLMPSAAFWWMIALSDRYFLLHYHGLDATGLYAAAARIPTLLAFLLGTFLEAWQYSALHTGAGQARAVGFGRIYRMLLPVAVIATSLLLVVTPLLVRILFAPPYREAVRFVPFLVLASLFSALSGFFGTAYTATMRSLPSLISAMIGSAVNFLLNFLLIPRFGTMGAALATLAAYLCVFAIRVGHTKSFLPFARYGTKSAVALLCLLLASLTVTAGAYRATPLCALLAMIPFWHEGVAVLWYLLKKWRILWEKRQKYQKKY